MSDFVPSVELREFIRLIIKEQTMPREWSFPDDNWLIPYYQIVEGSKAIEAHLDVVHAEIEALKRRIVELEKDCNDRSELRKAVVEFDKAIGII